MKGGCRAKSREEFQQFQLMFDEPTRWHLQEATLMLCNEELASVLPLGTLLDGWFQWRLHRFPGPGEFAGG